MKIFFAYLFQMLFDWQKKQFGNENHGALYASAILGILFGMNIMFVSYLISFLFYDEVIFFLRSYYIFIALLMVVATIFVLFKQKQYRILLSKVLQHGQSIHNNYRAIVITYLVITIIGYIVASYNLFSDIYEY